MPLLYSEHDFLCNLFLLFSAAINRFNQMVNRKFQNLLTICQKVGKSGKISKLLYKFVPNDSILRDIRVQN